MSGKEPSLSLPPVSSQWPGVITFLFCFVPSAVHRGNPSLLSKVHKGGVHHGGPTLLPRHWSPRKLHQFKTRRHLLPSLHTAQPDRQIGRDRQTELVRDNQRCLPTPPTWGWSSPSWPWFWRLSPSSCLDFLRSTMTGKVTGTAATPMRLTMMIIPWTSTPVSLPVWGCMLRDTLLLDASKFGQNCSWLGYKTWMIKVLSNCYDTLPLLHLFNW